jgi:ketoreductase
MAQATITKPTTRTRSSPVHDNLGRGAALVTGGGRGIGRSIGEALAAAGWKVALVARTLEQLQETASAINTAAGAELAHPIQGDVTDEASVTHFTTEAKAALGPIKLLVNGAGVADSAPYEQTDVSFLDRMYAVNLRGAHLVTSGIYPMMKEAGSGFIVNIASTAALQGFGYASAYSATKHGLLGLTRALAREAGKHGIRVNALCPGFVDTPLLANSIKNIVATTGRSSEEARKALAAMNRSGKLITPSEVAAGVLWLISEEARLAQGEAFIIDGGPTPWTDDSPLPVNPVALGPARGYSNGILYRGGRTLFVAGQVAWDSEQKIVGGDDFAAQFDAALGNVLKVVKEAGGAANQIGRMRIYVSDKEKYLGALKEIGKSYRSRMGHHFPAMALVEVARLLEENALVEIEAEAIL